MAERMTGFIKKMCNGEYGFILTDSEPRRQLFFNRRNMRHAPTQPLTEEQSKKLVGAVVSFKIVAVPRNKGSNDRAVDVEVLG